MCPKSSLFSVKSNYAFGSEYDRKSDLTFFSTLHSTHSGHFSSLLAQTNLTLAQHMTTSSKTASHIGLFSPHPCSAELWDLLFCLSVFTGPPGKRGRMGRRGEPGK